MQPETPRNAHRVIIDFDGGSLSGKLICPPGGCEPATVCACGRRYDTPDDEVAPCYDCESTKPSSCWVKSWFDSAAAEELLHGQVTVEIDAEWDVDTCIAHIVDVDRATSVLQAPETDKATDAA